MQHFAPIIVQFCFCKTVMTSQDAEKTWCLMIEYSQSQVIVSAPKQFSL